MNLKGGRGYGYTEGVRRRKGKGGNDVNYNFKKIYFFKCFPVLGIKPNFLHTRKVLLTLSPLLRGICQIIEDRNATNR
jgi:hypothetical protein